MLKKVLKNLYLHTEEFISVVFITIALILLTLQVILRFVFNTSFGWIEELSRYLYIWVIYLASSAAVRHDATIRIDVAENIWPRPIRKGVVVFGKIIMLIFCVYITVYAVQYVHQQMLKNPLSASMRISMWIPMLILPIGNGLISIRVLIDIIEDVFLHHKLVEDEDDLSKEVIE